MTVFVDLYLIVAYITSDIKDSSVNIAKYVAHVYGYDDYCNLLVTDTAYNGKSTYPKPWLMIACTVLLSQMAGRHNPK